MEIGLNRETIAARDPDATVDTRRMPFDPGTAAEFGDCGIWPMDEPGHVAPAVLSWLTPRKGLHVPIERVPALPLVRLHSRGRFR